MAGERRSRSSQAPGRPAVATADPGASPYASVVGALEAVELAARERRLVAEAEAEQILSRAGAAVERCAAAVPARISAAVRELRARHEAAADLEIREIEAAIRSTDADGAAAPATVERAAALLVAAVLGEGPGVP